MGEFKIMWIFLGAMFNLLGDILIKRWADGQIWLGWGILTYLIDGFIWARILSSGATLSESIVIWEASVILVGVGWGVLMENEVLSPTSIIGVIVTLLGILMVNLGSQH